MKNLDNIIFLDSSSILFPKKITYFTESDSPKVDKVAINLLNQINKKYNLKIVMIDSEFDSNKYKKEEIQLLLSSNEVKLELHEKWHIEYQSKVESPFLPTSRWIEENGVDNYLVFLNEKHKYKLDFYKESNLNFNYMHFVNEDNGLTLNNIEETYQSLKLWV